MVKKLEYSNLSVFTPSQISALFKINIESARGSLSRMAEEGTLVRVKRGHYCLPSSPVFSVASNLYPPSYISLWSAFEYYGTTTQSPRVVDVINSQKSGQFELSLEVGKFLLRFVKTRESFLYGIDKIYIDGNTTFIADREKAIIDGLIFTDYVPFGEVVEAIKDGIDVEKAMMYAERSGKQVVMKRLGYLLSQEGFDVDPICLSDTYVPLDPSFPRRGSYHTGWRVIDNRRSI